MKKSETIVKLAGAMSKAQAEMPAVKMNAVNPFLKNKYADLGAVIETSRPVLARHGLAVVQTPVSDGDKIGVTTIITHESGEWMEDTIMLDIGEEKGKSRAQVAGSVITYLRRYSLSAILGMYADEDTDASAPKPTAKPAQSSAPMTIEAARAMKDAQGHLYGEKTVEQLTTIINTPAAPEDKKQAARLLIEAKKEG